MVKKHGLMIHLCSAATVLLLALYLFLFGCPHYDLSDDAILADALIGAVGGVKESVNVCVLPPLFRALHLLSVLFPTVVWFSVLQIALLALSAWTMISASIRLFEKLQKPLWIGYLFGALLAWIFVLAYGNFISFTQTAAIAGTAAVWQLLGIDWKKEHNRCAIAWSVTLLFLSFCLRWETGLAAFVFWIGALLCVWLLEKAAFRRVACVFLVCLVLLGMAALTRETEVIFSEEADYLKWQNARFAVTDYASNLNEDDELLSVVGWTSNDFLAMKNWCLMDEAFTTDAFETLSSALRTRRVWSGEGIRSTVKQLITKHRNVLWMTVLLLFLCASSFALACLLPPPHRRCWVLLAPVLCALCALALLMYLILRGRLPMRAALSVLMPACAPGFYLLIRVGFSLRGKAKVLSLVSACMCAVLLFPLVRFAFFNSYQPYNLPKESVFTQLDAYACEHPDTLFIGSGSLGRDPRLFPDRSNGLPDNVLIGFGSWNNESAGYRAVMNRFCYTGLSDFANGSLRLVTHSGEEPPAFLIALLQEKTGKDITWTSETVGDLCIHAFHTSDLKGAQTK